MASKIGFTAKQNTEESTESIYIPKKQPENVKKSVVQVRFPNHGNALAYYNDTFDLQRGDFVFVEGKFEGIRGCVEEVNYNFKINLNYYKKVISVADTNIKGNFILAGSHLITFDPAALPIEKAKSWFLPYKKEDRGEIVSGNDDFSFSLDNLNEMEVPLEIMKRGHDYYWDNKVLYINLNGNRGYAIVDGKENVYEVEFDYRCGEISKIVCSCFCSYNCKHEVAVMMQLKESLNIIEKDYPNKSKEEYLSIIEKSYFFNFTTNYTKRGNISF